MPWKRSPLVRCLLVAGIPLLATELILSQEIGPTDGALVLVGGAMRDPVIVERFLALAGGDDAPVVVIPTAGGEDTYDQSWPGLRAFTNAGATDVTVMHTTDRDVANSESFVTELRRARGVWFGGGRQWRLVDAYLDTKVHHEIQGVLDRGGVVGGSSAGASILGSYLVRGDTRTNTIMMGDHEEGLGFLRGVGIDQHLLRRNRHADMIEVLRTRPELLGIGLDEDTAIVVSGDMFEVIGQSYVAIYDNQRSLNSGAFFYFLTAGDRYDMRARQPSRSGRDRDAFDRVVEVPWPPQPAAR